jgi:microcompartment protein CcmK/EutM
MDLARVIGTVVATRKDPTLVSSKLCVLRRVDKDLKPFGDALIATDATAMRGEGDLVYIVESGDAVFTGLQGEDMPVDAAIVGIVNDYHIQSDLI